MLQGRGSLIQTRYEVRNRRYLASFVFPPALKGSAMTNRPVLLRVTFDFGAPPGDERLPVEVNVPPDAEPNSPAAISAAAKTEVDKEAREKVQFCVAVDFDGVLARKAWPAVGEEMPGAVAFLKWLDEQGWWRVLFTCREGGHLKAALGWLDKQGYGEGWWTAVNATPKPITDQYGSDSRKIGFHALIDDLAIGFPAKKDGAPDWERIKAELEERAAEWKQPSSKE